MLHVLHDASTFGKIEGVEVVTQVCITDPVYVMQVLGVQQLARMQVSGDSSVFFDFVL